MNFSRRRSKPGAEAAGSGAHGPLSGDDAARVAAGRMSSNCANTIAAIAFVICPNRTDAVNRTGSPTRRDSTLASGGASREASTSAAKKSVDLSSSTVEGGTEPHAGAGGEPEGRDGVDERPEKRLYWFMRRTIVSELVTTLAISCFASLAGSVRNRAASGGKS